MKNNLAIIPARAGSKRIPQKNIKGFLGKPIIAYSIEIAQSSGLFSEIMVSTDNKKIAEIARQYGAQVPFFRSSENSDDYATLNDVLVETIDCYKKRGLRFDFTCMILPTAPLIQKSTLEESFRILRSEEFDSIRPIVKFSYPIQRSLRLKDMKIEMMNPEFYRTRSQDLEPAYHDAGQFYWINTDKTLTDKNKGGIIVSEMEVQDIDNEVDWTIAEMKYKVIHNLE